MSDRWELIRAIHSDKTGIPPNVVDYIAVRDILFSCISGISNKSIADFFHMDEEYVREVIEEFFDTSGLSVDLPVRPYFFYKQDMSGSEFADKLSEYLDPSSIMDMYLACAMFDKIKEEIIKYDK